MKTRSIILWIVILAAVFMLMNNKVRGNGKWTIYGTRECGWTRKQMSHFDESGVAYDFVDCKNGNCEEFRAYPTTVSPNGEVKVGFFKL